MNFTNGHGFDAIIITAAAPSNDPIGTFQQRLPGKRESDSCRCSKNGYSKRSSFLP